jgi:hypothetical protein
MSWRDHIRVHPAAALFPMMSDDELKMLGEDIKKHGLTDYICFWFPTKDGYEKLEGGYLLDGRNRLEAMERAGLDISFDGYNGLIKRFFCGDDDKYSDPYAYVISANLHRRHLTAQDKRRLIGNLLKVDPGKSNRYIAGLLGVDHKTVGSVRAELESPGEIPQLGKTVGKDGKSRQQPSRKLDRQHPAPALAPDQAERGAAVEVRRTAAQVEHAVCDVGAGTAGQVRGAPADPVASLPSDPAERSAAERKAHYTAAEEDREAPISGYTVTIEEHWRQPLADAEENLGIPAHEFVSFIMWLGNQAFNRKFQSGLNNHIAWWLIEMHSKYPDTFNASSWEGSCGELALDRLYEDRGIPVGKYAEWKAAGAKAKPVDQEAIADLRKRAKRFGLKMRVKNGVTTVYELTSSDGFGRTGTLQSAIKHLDDIEAACAANPRKSVKAVIREINAAAFGAILAAENARSIKLDVAVADDAPLPELDPEEAEPDPDTAAPAEPVPPTAPGTSRKNWWDKQAGAADAQDNDDGIPDFLDRRARTAVA